MKSIVKWLNETWEADLTVETLVIGIILCFFGVALTWGCVIAVFALEGLL